MIFIRARFATVSLGLGSRRRLVHPGTVVWISAKVTRLSVFPVHRAGFRWRLVRVTGSSSVPPILVAGVVSTSSISAVPPVSSASATSGTSSASTSSVDGCYLRDSHARLHKHCWSWVCLIRGLDGVGYGGLSLVELVCGRGGLHIGRLKSDWLEGGGCYGYS